MEWWLLGDGAGGNRELFNGHRVLVLQDEEFCGWMEGDDGGTISTNVFNANELCTLPQ